MPRTFRYTPESIVIATSADLHLEFAACHVLRVGLAQGDLFAGAGRTVYLPCSAVGAVMVGAGHARQHWRRTYPWEQIRAERRRAFALLAAEVGGASTAVAVPEEHNPEDWHQFLVQRWNDEPGRTAKQVATALRATADAARQSTDGALRPRKPNGIAL